MILIVHQTAFIVQLVVAGVKYEVCPDTVKYTGSTSDYIVWSVGDI